MAAPAAPSSRPPRIWVVEAADSDDDDGGNDLTPREAAALKYAMTMCLPYLKWWDLRACRCVDDDDPDVDREGLRGVTAGTVVGQASRADAAARSPTGARCYVLAFHCVEELMQLLPTLGRPDAATPEFWAKHAWAVDAALLHKGGMGDTASVTLVAGFFRRPRSFSYVHDAVCVGAWLRSCAAMRATVRMGALDVDRTRALEMLRVLVGNVSPVHDRAQGGPAASGARLVDGLREACFTCGARLAGRTTGPTTCAGCGVVRFCSSACRRAAASPDKGAPSHAGEQCLHAWMLAAIVRPHDHHAAAARKAWDSAPGMPLVMTGDGAFNDDAYSTLLWDVSTDPLTCARVAPGFIKPAELWKARATTGGAPVGSFLTEAHWSARTAVRPGDRVSVPAFCAVVRVGDDPDAGKVDGGGVTARYLLRAIYGALSAPCTPAHVRAMGAGVVAQAVPGRTRVVQLNPWARRFASLKEKDGARWCLEVAYS